MADTFTPEQITQILEEFFKVVGTRKYIGERYVPIFGRKGEESIQWDNSAPYEPLTIVLYQGNSYTSRQYVPIGVDITNQDFWALTGNYNAQIENALAIANNAQNDIDTLLPKVDFSAENTVKKYIDEIPTRFPTMSTAIKGIAKVGAGLAMNGDALELDGNGDIATAVTSWLNEHPEATTTVQDGAITGPKIADNTIPDSKLVQTGGVLGTVNNFIGVEQIPHTVANGLPHSTGNPNFVRIVEPINISYGDIIEANVLEDAPSGYSYCFAFYTYYGDTLIGKYSHIWLDSGYSPNFYGVYFTPSDTTGNQIKIAVGLVDGSGNFMALRADTFTSESIEIVRYKWGHALDGNQAFSLFTMSNDGVDNLGNYAMFGNNSMTAGNVTGPAPRRVVSDHIFSFDRAITLRAASGFRFGIHKFVDGKFAGDSSWQTRYTIPAGTTFKIIISRASEDTSERAVVSDFVQAVTFETELSERVSMLEYESPISFSYFGAPINTKKQGFTCNQLSWAPQANQTNEGGGQGFGIFGDTLFQCYAGGVVQLYDMTDGSKIAEYTLVGEHCDCVDFSNEYYDASDNYPLMYVTADTSPAVVYVNRVTTSGATLIRTLRFPIKDAGYYAGHATDAANNCLYMVGYAEQNYQTDPNGTNNMIVSKWDLGNLTNNEGIYTPEKLASFRIPFIYTAQGQCFFDGKIFVVSSLLAAVQQTRVYVIDPAAEGVVAVITDIPSNLLNNECEGVAFHLDGDEYEMILGTSKNYYSAKFA